MEKASPVIARKLLLWRCDSIFQQNNVAILDIGLRTKSLLEPFFFGKVRGTKSAPNLGEAGKHLFLACCPKSEARSKD